MVGYLRCVEDGLQVSSYARLDVNRFSISCSAPFVRARRLSDLLGYWLRLSRPWRDRPFSLGDPAI